MGLPWVRLDANIASHDKVLALIADKRAGKWQGAASYPFGMAWSGGQGTDGFIPEYALQWVHGTPQTARLLIDHGLWIPVPGGYQIHNFTARQQTNSVTREVIEAQVEGGRRGACSRWHGDDCWQEETGCSQMGT